MGRAWIGGAAAGFLIAILAAGLYFQATGQGVCFEAREAPDFLGPWKRGADSAVSHDATFPDAVVVTGAGAAIFVRAATCSSASCDLEGERTSAAQLCATYPLASRARSLVFDVERGFATDHDVLMLRADGDLDLIVTVRWIIMDGGPRPDSHARLHLVRADVKR